MDISHSWTAFSVDYALQFNGTNGYVFTDAGDGHQRSSLTVLIWVKVAPGQTGQIPLAWVIQEDIFLFIEDGKLKGRFLGTVAVGQVVPVDKWMHVSLVYNYTGEVKTLTVYVNAVAGETENVDTLTHHRHDLIFGRYGNDSNATYYKGEMDELSLWSTDMTPSEIEARALEDELDLTTPNLVVYYKMNVEANTLIDEAGHFNGTLNGELRQVESTLVKEF
jgi:hypothetical protein